MSTIDAINAALATVIDPELHKPLPELGMVDSVDFKDKLKSDITNSLKSIEEIKSLEIVFGVMNEEQRNNVKKLIRGGREKFIPFAQPDSLTRVLGIASGKGGVGKSSVTVNLAVAAAAKGLKVGILDADVYGHSIPRLMGILDKRPTAIDQTFIPVENYGVKVVSMEMFKPERSDPVAYRGAHQIKQPVIGVIENMSDTECSKCGEKLSVFGSGGGEETSRRLSQLVGATVPLLAKIPFNSQLREGGDEGNPIVLSDEKYKKVFDEILDQIIIRPKSLVGVRLNINT